MCSLLRARVGFGGYLRLRTSFSISPVETVRVDTMTLKRLSEGSQNVHSRWDNLVPGKQRVMSYCTRAGIKRIVTELDKLWLKVIWAGYRSIESVILSQEAMPILAGIAEADRALAEVRSENGTLEWMQNYLLKRIPEDSPNAYSDVHPRSRKHQRKPFSRKEGLKRAVTKLDENENKGFSGAGHRTCSAANRAKDGDFGGNPIPKSEFES